MRELQGDSAVCPELGPLGVLANSDFGTDIFRANYAVSVSQSVSQSQCQCVWVCQLDIELNKRQPSRIRHKHRCLSRRRWPRSGVDADMFGLPARLNVVPLVYRVQGLTLAPQSTEQPRNLPSLH